jgi:hypothetical protein
MVVAGCLHEPAPDAAGFRNRPAVVTPDGELAWDYWKRRPFQSALLDDKLELFGPACDHLVAIDTALGRVAVTICLDFLDYRVQSVLRELRANVVVVPAMTSGDTVTRDFVPRARFLTNDLRAATVFANSTVPLRLTVASGTEALEPTLSFLRGNTRVSSVTPLCADTFGPENTAATVCVYRLRSQQGGRLSVQRQRPFRHPA